MRNSWTRLRYALLAILPAVALALPAAAADDDKNKDNTTEIDNTNAPPAATDSSNKSARDATPTQKSAPEKSTTAPGRSPSDSDSPPALGRDNANPGQSGSNQSSAERSRERSNRNNAQNRNRNSNAQNDDDAADRTRQRQERSRDSNSANRDLDNRDNRDSNRDRDNRDRDADRSERSRDSDRDNRDSANRDRDRISNRDSADRREGNRDRRDGDRSQERRFSSTPNRTGGARDISRFGVNLNVNNDRLVVNELRDQSVFRQWGVRQGDVIVSVGGRPVSTQADFTRYLFVRNVDRIPLVVLRDGSEETIYVVTREFHQHHDAPHGGGAYLGVSFRPIREEGALVASVTRGSPADNAGFQRDDLITEINGEPVRNENDVIDAVRSMQPGDSVEVVYLRGRHDETIEVVLGEKRDRARAQVQERTQIERYDDQSEDRFYRGSAPRNASADRGRANLNNEGAREPARSLRNAIRGSR